MTHQATQHRISLLAQGAVQGVGFRPFVHRLAMDFGLAGGVKNTPNGVVIDIEGGEAAVCEFRQRLQQELPPHATIHTLEQQSLPPQGATQFEIWASDAVAPEVGLGAVSVLPDLSTCSDCLQEVFTSHNRRHQYAFTNCTHCGPRFSVITALPYDRHHTTLADFTLCPDCQAEYANPRDRRFHAQPNACPRCGPALAFWANGHQQQGEPLQQAIAALQHGKVIALKGLGGFQLLTDAQNPKAVARLRQRKHRPDKPLALMYPDLDYVRRHCQVSAAAADLLTSAQGPIVLLPKRPRTKLAPAIAPGNSYLGVMLPTTPLHHLLLRQYGAPLVATSGNVSGEPICIEEQEAFHNLGGMAFQNQPLAIADGFLVHNRPIQHPVDDSVVQLVQDQPQVLRHARGYAPQVIELPDWLTPPVAGQRILAVGAHLKSAIALSSGSQIVLGPHIGDLGTPEAMDRLHQTITDFLALYQCQPTAIACDLHPDYGSTRLAQTLAQQWHAPLIPVQHHYAHALSGIAEHQLQAPVLAVTWDGAGYGADQTIWGGEFLQITDGGFERVAHLLPFPLPGGNVCSRKPWRSAAGLLYACYGKAAFELDLAPLQPLNPFQRNLLLQMLTHQINTPMTSSMGRLFDGIAALLNLHQTTSFEGQAAMSLEFAAEGGLQRRYPFAMSQDQPYIVNWTLILRAVVADLNDNIPRSIIAARFHRTLAEIVGAIARLVGTSQVLLTGGCFQNRLLTEQTTQQLEAQGFTVYHHQRVPPNDGGIAVGQVIGALQSVASLGGGLCA
ncbi:MAG: carbamoyltransferase HypF [Elainellaceae cyanobacterium]